MNRLRTLWRRLQASLWFVPALVVTAAIALAFGLVELHPHVDADLARTWPRLFGSGSEGARGMLSAIATSMVTVAGVVFSVTIVALSQASSQYSPRVLGNFMRDRSMQVVLGVFVGVFAYCLVVLRTVRGDDGDGGFLPSLAVFAAVVLALVGVATLIFFIHHVASAIQASAIVERIAHDTACAIDRLFPDDLGRSAAPDELPPVPTLRWHDVPAVRTGYVVGVDDAGLLAFASRHDRIVRLACRIGDFAIAGRPIAAVSGDAPLPRAEARALCRLVAVQRDRTVDQDAPCGLLQIVDVALKALSPGINDPTTAVLCIDHLGALGARLAARHIPGSHRSDGQRLRVIAPGASFEDMVALAFDAIADHARGEADVLARLLQAIAAVAAATSDPGRRAALQRRLALVREAADRSVASPARRQALLAQADTLAASLSTRHARPGPMPHPEPTEPPR